MGVFDKIGFGNKKKQALAAGGDSPVIPAGGAPAVFAVPKRNKNELLSSVLGETVFAQNMRDLMGLPNFKVTINGLDYYACWMLDVQTIGGLSKKTNRDEAKGQLIEALKASRIKHILTPALLAAERIVFVGDNDTIEAMGESSILAEATYTLVFVQENGDIEDFDQEIVVSYDDLYNVSDSDGTIYDILESVHGPWSEDDIEDMIGFGGFDEDDIEDDFNASSVLAVKPASASVFLDHEGDMPDEFDDEFDNFEPSVPQIPQVPPVVPSVEPEPAFSVSQSVPVAEAPAAAPAAQTAPVQQSHIETDVIVGPEFVSRRTEAVFCAHGLNLALSTDRFHDMFGKLRPLSLPTDRDISDGFMAEHLNHMCEMANAELTRMHDAHMYELLRQFNVVGSEFVHKVGDMYDADNINNPLGVAVSNIEKARATELEVVEKSEAEFNAEIDAEFEEKVKAYGEDARRRAEADYRTRHEKANEARKKRFMEEERDKIEHKYSDKTHELSQKALRMADTRLEKLIEELLKRLGHTWDVLRREEEETFNHFKHEVDQFIAQHAKDDIEYANVIRREQELQTKVMDMQAETDRLLMEKQRDCDERIARLQTEMDDQKRYFERQREDMQTKNDADMRAAERRNADLESQVSDLLDRVDRVRRETAQEYEHRLNMSADARQAAEDRCASMDMQRKHTNVIGVALAVAIGVACGCLGLVVGIASGIGSAPAAPALLLMV